MNDTKMKTKTKTMVTVSFEASELIFESVPTLIRYFRSAIESSGWVTYKNFEFLTRTKITSSSATSVRS